MAYKEEVSVFPRSARYDDVVAMLARLREGLTAVLESPIERATAETGVVHQEAALRLTIDLGRLLRLLGEMRHSVMPGRPSIIMIKLLQAFYSFCRVLGTCCLRRREAFHLILFDLSSDVIFKRSRSNPACLRILCSER